VKGYEHGCKTPIPQSTARKIFYGKVKERQIFYPG